MELRHLRYFVAVAEEQNVTRAAARLHVSQPALSRQIRDLEDELGVALFERTAKAVRLSEAGRVFVSEAKAVLLRADEAVGTVKSVAKGQHGEIHVGYAPSLTVEILPRALRSFQEANPGVRVHLHDLSTEEMLGGLREDRLDVALLIHPSEKALGGLAFEELVRYPVCVAAHGTHRVARARKVGLDDLANERLIVYTRADYPEYHDWLATLFAPRKLAHIAEEYDSATSLIAAVEAGRGVALVPRAFECLSGPRLKVRPISPAPPPFIVGVARRKKPSSPQAEKFIAAIKLSGTNKD
jgi:DNA-binding transcriptional LysR family regulator